MGDTHSISFFGQNAGLFLNSSSKLDPYFFMRVIKKKPNGSWEKPSKGEGKVIKFSLEEAIMILQVLNRRLMSWKSYHTYNENKTPISFNWEDEKANTLWINIDQYSKMLNFAQTEILRMLVGHLLKEKIKYATRSIQKSAKKNSSNKEIFPDFPSAEGIIEFQEDIKNNSLEEIEDYNFNEIPPESPIQNSNNGGSKKAGQINGTIKGETAKALLIQFNSGHELWIPKSTIHSEYLSEKELNQKFIIDKWILKKNKILT